MIKIVGLGAGDVKYLTNEALDVLNNSSEIYLRTEKHPSVSYIKTVCSNVKSFDYIYNQESSFDNVYLKIVEELINLSKGKDIVYCVPGNPFVAEKTVDLIKENLKAREYSIIYGISFLDLIISRLKIDPVYGFSVVDATSLSTQNLFHKGFMVITQCYDRMIASEVKLWLSNFIDDEDYVTVVNSIGVENEENILSIRLFELDRSEVFGDMTTIVVDLKNQKKNLNDFILTLMSKNKTCNKELLIDDIIRSASKIKFNDENEEDEIKKIISLAIKISILDNDYYNFFDLFN